MAIATQTIEEPAEFPSGVDLWVVAPKFTERPFAQGNAYTELIDDLADKSNEDSTLILWVHIRNLAENTFWNPLFENWTRHGVILSGSGDRSEIGLVFSNSPLKRARDVLRFHKNKWKSTVIWSEAGGPKCSNTCKWILNKISGDGESKLVCEPYAKGDTLALWCRRMNMTYRGYSKYQVVRDRIEKGLAQIELPGIQQMLPISIG